MAPVLNGFGLRQRIENQGGVESNIHCRHCQGFRVLSLGVNLDQQRTHFDHVTRPSSLDELLFR